MTPPGCSTPSRWSRRSGTPPTWWPRAWPWCRARLEAYRNAQWKFDQRWAATYLNADGPVEERKQKCVLACATEQANLDVAEVAYKFAERKARAAESTLSAYQTLSRSITAMYGAAGRGEY